MEGLQMDTVRVPAESLGSSSHCPMGISLAAAQAIDPFYLRLFEDGEAAFVAGDHAKAVKDLEVAVFGLSADRVRSVRSCIYLALSHSSLKNAEKSAQFLRRAVGLLGDADPRSLGLAEGALNAHERLRENCPAEAGSEEKAPGLGKPPQTAPPRRETHRRSGADQGIEGVWKELDNDRLLPRSRILYVSRRDFSQDGQAHARPSKETPKSDGDLPSLPGLYFQKDYRKAIEGFHKIIGPASEEKVTRDAVLRSTIYIVLCLDALDQKQSLNSYLDYLTQNIALADLRRLVAEEGLDRDWEKLKGE
jgi:hypothetical protein